MSPDRREGPAGRWSFAFSRRWFGYLAVAVVFAIACVLLSNWQWARLDEASAANELVDENWTSEPAPLTELVRELDGWDDTIEYRPVEVTGVYDVDAQLLVRNRPMNGNPGFEVLTPLRLTDGTVFVIDRGWLPTGNAQDLPDVVPAPPAGEVTVVARLKQGEPELPGRSAPAGQIPTIHLEDVEEALDEPVYTGAYGDLASESPAPAQAAPTASVRPEADEGLHISYAIQWVLFAIGGFFGLGWAIRHEYRIVNSEDPEEKQRAAAREAKRAARRSDADVEDAILDRT